MSIAKNELNSIIETCIAVEKTSDASKQLAANLALFNLSIQSIIQENLRQALLDLAHQLKKIGKSQELAALELANRILQLMLSHHKINGSQSETGEEIDKKFNTALKQLVKDLEIKGPTWGKVLGIVLIIAGILLSLASFATMIPSFGASTAAVPVAVTWTLAGISFFSTSIGCASEYLSADAATDLSTAVQTIAKVC